MDMLEQLLRKITTLATVIAVSGSSLPTADAYVDNSGQEVTVQWKKDESSVKTEEKREPGATTTNCTPSLSGNTINVVCETQSSEKQYQQQIWQECAYNVTKSTETRKGSKHFWQGALIGGLVGGVGGGLLGKEFDNPAAFFVLFGFTGGLAGGLIGYNNAPTRTKRTEEKTGNCIAKDSGWSYPKTVTSPPQPLANTSVTFSSQEVTLISNADSGDRVSVTTSSGGKASVQFQPSTWYLVQTPEQLTPVVSKDVTNTVFQYSGEYNAKVHIATEGYQGTVAVPLYDVRPAIDTLTTTLLAQYTNNVHFQILDADTYTQIPACERISVTAIEKVPTPQQLLSSSFHGEALEYAIRREPPYSAELVLQGTGEATVYVPMRYHFVAVCPPYYAFDTHAQGKKPLAINSASGVIQVYLPRAPGITERIEHRSAPKQQSRVEVH